MIDTFHITHKLTKQEYENLKRKLPNIKKVQDEKDDPLGKLDKNQVLFRSSKPSQSFKGLTIFLREFTNRIRIKGSNATKKQVFYTIELNGSGYRLLHPQSTELESIGKLVYEEDFEDFFKVLYMIIDNISYEIGFLDIPQYRADTFGVKVKDNKLAGWKVNRLDYTINIHTPNVEEYIKLFQKADKPSSKADFRGVINKRKKEKQLDGSFYLKSKSININFYNKLDQTRKKLANQKIALPPRLAQELSDILRFEVQCKSAKLSNLKHKYGFKTKNFPRFYSKDIALDTILDYYDETIGLGNYYKLSKARKIIDASSHGTRLKNSLKDTLTHIATKRSVWRARQTAENEINIKPVTFNEHLQYIRELGINPVTIPKSWTIDELPNLRNKIIESIDK